MVSKFDSSRADWSAWRASRVEGAKSPLGKLALVQTTWLPEDAIFDPRKATLDQPTTVTATEIERRDFDGNLLAHGYRLWDSNSEAIQNFIGIETFDFDAKWIIEGKFKAYENSKPIAFEFIKDNGGTRDLAVPGVIEATIEGVEYRLFAFDDDGQLILPFTDLTNSVETYESGRFLLVDHIAGIEYVVLDFNRAFAPPCAFSNHFNCPLAPAGNRIGIAVRAGEKRPLFKNQVK
ncbi:MAG: DUF1684 domain-containing protein [Actinobacteria bacterium]|nr:DUF1684 domain-containing protein [Actinomycetota bacterium]